MIKDFHGSVFSDMVLDINLWAEKYGYEVQSTDSIVLHNGKIIILVCYKPKNHNNA
jgi:hypothetical protein